MKELSNRSANFTDSVIRRMTRVANKYGAVNLSQGFPDFDPPKAITDRLARVACEGPHQYACDNNLCLRINLNTRKMFIFLSNCISEILSSPCQCIGRLDSHLFYEKVCLLSFM